MGMNSAFGKPDRRFAGKLRITCRPWRIFDQKNAICDYLSLAINAQDA